MKTKYYNFYIGQKVILNNPVVCEGRRFNTGHNFIIISFPDCVIITKKYQNFVYGKDNENNNIRCFINEIIAQ